jgi:general secretion pathway protein A
MAFAATEQRVDGRRPLVEWHGNARFPAALYPPEVLEGLTELVMSGYQRYPWGGVEAGGILFGKKESDAIHVYSFQSVECEHEHGPSFELSKRDLESFDRLLAGVASDQTLNGLVPVGWYHSISRRELSLANCDRALHERFFPHSWQLAMVLQRSKKDPLSIGLFCGGSHGSLEPHSPQREFAIENFRLRLTEVPPAQLTPATPLPVEPEPTIQTPNVEPQASAPELPGNRFGPLGLTEDPFSPTPDPRYFYPAPQHQEALASLIYGIQSRQGFLAVIGETGTGKSLVLECLIEHLKANSIDFACLFNSKINPEEFFQLLAHDLELRCRNTTKTSILIALNEYLLRRSQEGQTTVLIVDSAQKLGVDVLEEIELLGNLENRRGRLLQVIFAAQPSFDRQLEKAELRGLRQRMLMRARLGPLQCAQTSQYVESRLAQAGLAHQRVFPADLLADIHTRTQGIPRLINAVCSKLLTLCQETHVDQADLRMLDRVSAELELDPQNAGAAASHEDQ